MTLPVQRVLGELGVGLGRVQPIPSTKTNGAANWHIWPSAGQRCVLRRYRHGTTADELDYEHAILAYLSAQGWTVPSPLGEPIEYDDHWYCLTRFVPRGVREEETPSQRRQRGTDLAHLDLALRPLADTLGQRPRRRPQHSGVTVHTGMDWDASVSALAAEHPQLAEQASGIATAIADEFASIGAADLPLNIVHGDFAAWNVHYDGARLAGVLDFELAHLDSRPFELAVARMDPCGEACEAYRDEMAQLGWPLTDLEEAALGPVYRACQLGMLASELEAGRQTGRFNTEEIDRYLVRVADDLAGEL